MDNAELRPYLDNPMWRSLTIEIDGETLKRLLDDSDELARLKRTLEIEIAGRVRVYTFLTELLKDVETQRDTSADGSYSTGLDPVDRQHYRSRASSMAYVAERIRYFLETPAKEPEK